MDACTMRYESSLVASEPSAFVPPTLRFWNGM